MKVAIAYADDGAQLWLRLDVPEDTTVGAAIEQSGLLDRHPQLDLAQQKVGVFGRFVGLDAKLAPGDRIEIYRAIICDPAQVPRRAGCDDD